jgi:hypothetical protein
MRIRPSGNFSIRIIIGFGLLNRLKDSARHRAYISSPVTANFRFVVQTAQRKAHKLAVQRPRD